MRLVVLRTSRVADEDSKIRDLELLRQQARVKTSAGVLNIGSPPDYVSSQAVRRLRAVLPAQCEAQEKRARAPMANLVGNHVVERRPQPSTTRRRRSAERKKHRQKHHRPGHDNFRQLS
ncbi:MAG: hypothetical protein DMF12_07345 [Verrucomicrobia bacterium]|nr:MAG: hypothetical protein DMF12_07345 [Verrucomicrobiota bacterium]